MRIEMLALDSMMFREEASNRIYDRNNNQLQNRQIRHLIDLCIENDSYLLFGNWQNFRIYIENTCTGIETFRKKADGQVYDSEKNQLQNRQIRHLIDLCIENNCYLLLEY